VELERIRSRRCGRHARRATAVACCIRAARLCVCAGARAPQWRERCRVHLISVSSPLPLPLPLPFPTPTPTPTPNPSERDSIRHPRLLPCLLGGSLPPRRAADRVVDHVVIVVRVVIADGDRGRGCGQARLHDRFADRDGIVLARRRADAR